MSMRAIFNKISYSCFNGSSGNLRIRSFQSLMESLPGYRDTKRHFETKEEERQFNEVKYGRFLLTRWKKPDLLEQMEQMAHDEMYKCAYEEFGVRYDYELTPEEIEREEALEKQKHIEYEIDDKKLEEEVEAIIRSGDFSKIGSPKI